MKYFNNYNNIRERYRHKNTTPTSRHSSQNINRILFAVALQFVAKSGSGGWGGAAARHQESNAELRAEHQFAHHFAETVFPARIFSVGEIELCTSLPEFEINARHRPHGGTTPDRAAFVPHPSVPAEFFSRPDPRRWYGWHYFK